MEGDRELGHCCKVCGKSFPSGRSLGGHMRSHVYLNSSPDAEELPRPASGRSSIAPGAGYGLRENPRKTWRLSDSIGDNLCKECGKVFPSRNSLFGHMRCHAGERSSLALDEEEEQALESESDNEATAAMVTRRRGRRRSRRVAAIPASSSSVSEQEKEQEDVAYSLMMLSRDAGYWAGVNSITESSDKNSVVWEQGDWAEKGSQLGVPRNGCSMNGLKRVESDVSDDGFARDDEFKKPRAYEFEEGFDELSRKGKNLNPGVAEIKRKAGFFQCDSETEMPTSSKKGKFDAGYECATCNKSFRTYQALGGHRASHHKKSKCFRMDGGEDSVETDASIEPTAIGERVECNVGSRISYGLAKKEKDHECPICHKVFASGQALGGHKRSHMVASSNGIGGGGSGSPPAIAIQQQAQHPVMRDMLDLNLPAPVDEDSVSNNENVDFRPWWVGHNHNLEPLVGMISN